MDGSVKTLYIGNVEIVVNGATTTFKRSIAGGVLQTVVGSTATNYFLFNDQLGNLVRIADAAGAVVNTMDFFGFGSRRDPDTQSAGGTAPSVTNRGFTGHEMIDGATELVHMNARLFDPNLGRFLQADPVIQSPDNAQSWNAYTYVFNNPYRYTDPTGMIGTTERQWLGTIVAIVATAFAPKGAGLWYSMLVGAVAGGISTGTWQGALYGAFSAGVFYGIGSYYQGQAWANGFEGMFGGDVQTVGSTGLTAGQLTGKVIAHGIAGGVMSRLQGGKFGDGFLSAGVAELGSPMIDEIGPGRMDPNYAGARVAVAAVVGGTTSALTGGKFANGAITAAFSRAFNDELHLDALRRANSVTAYIDDYIAKNPSKVIPLSSSEFMSLAEKDYMQANDFVNDNPDMSYYEFTQNMRWGPGDGVMAQYGTQAFRIQGIPGIQLGSDINYMLQGMAWSSKGIPMYFLRSAIAAHNELQFSQDIGRGNFTARNLLQISRANQWAQFGHDYYLQKQKMEGR